MEAELANDKVTPATYHHLIKIGQVASPLISKFHQIIQKSLKLEKIYRTDTELLLAPKIQKEYSVAEGKIIIRNALKPLGDEYSQYLERA